MKFFRKNWGKLLMLISAFLLPVVSFAVDTNGQPCNTGFICNPLSNATSVQGFIQTLLTGVIKIGIPVIALAIIYSGFLFVAARGNSEKLEKAKDAFFYTLIGAAILLGSLAIATLISNTVLGL